MESLLEVIVVQGLGFQFLGRRTKSTASATRGLTRLAKNSFLKGLIGSCLRAFRGDARDTLNP